MSRTRAGRFFEEAEDTICYLADRWEDEHEYEKITDYQSPLDPIAARCGVRITRMTERPFGCEFVDGIRKFRLAVVGDEYSYHVIDQN
jgi:hypothetical protein